MTNLVIEQFHTPDTHRSERSLESARRRAAEQLARRTVLKVGEPLQGLIERLDAMLRGVTMLAPALGPRRKTHT